MSPSDHATLSLLDPDQGVCPDGHRCAVAAAIGRRACKTCVYKGIALTCWAITTDHIDRAELAGADALVVASARSFIANREWEIG
jgi:hypothetical protein